MDQSTQIPSDVLPDVDSLVTKLLSEKKSAFLYQKRKHDDWNENYELYRNKVRINRLTQRQNVSIPLMKETIKTALSNVDDPPTTEWVERSGDEVKQIIYQSIWDKAYKETKMEWTDILDKKNVLIYGLSTKLLNLSDEYVKIMVLDPYDVLYDPIMNPMNIETARYIIHQNIFMSLREVLASDRYTEEGKKALGAWSNTQAGIVQSNDNREALQKKEARLRAMGVTSEYFAQFVGGDTIVSLSAHYTNVWDTKKQKFVRHCVVQAQDAIVLQDKELIDLIGIEEWPFEYWVEDLETVDIYPDSVADLVRVPNKVINAWFSQLVENRTLRNFQMHWYDATVQGYVPQTYEPGQGRMLPAPGDPNKTIMPVNISGLDETMDAINFLTNIVERGSGVTAVEKGSPEGGTQTLGEVQILVGKAQERANSMKTFYRSSWYATCRKWDKITQANNWPSIKLYKTGISGKIYEKIVTDKDWKSKAGFEPNISSSSELEESNVKNLQKFAYVRSLSPQNQALKKIALKRSLMLIDVSSQELQEIQDEEARMEKMMAQVPQLAAPGVPQPAGAPSAQGPTQPPQAPGGAMNPDIQAAMQSKMQELANLPTE